jgi:hypothetical protein
VSTAVAAYAGPRFEDAVLRMIKVFRDRGIKVHIIGPVAALHFRMGCVIKAAEEELNFDACGSDADEARRSLQSIHDIFARAAARDSGVTYSLPIEFMCNMTNCSPAIENVFVYRSDGVHLNRDGAALLAKFIHLPTLE